MKIFGCVLFFSLIVGLQFANAGYQPPKQKGIRGNGWVISFKTEIDEVDNGLGLKVADFILIYHHQSNKLVILGFIATGALHEEKGIDNCEAHLIVGLKHLIDDDKQRFFWAMRGTTDFSKFKNMLEKPEFRGMKEFPDTKPLRLFVASKVGPKNTETLIAFLEKAARAYYDLRLAEMNTPRVEEIVNALLAVEPKMLGIELLEGDEGE